MMIPKNKRINLVTTAAAARITPWDLGGAFDWSFGKELDPKILDADAVLFWDPAQALPGTAILQALLDSPEDVWHAGLKLGMNGLPHAMDFVMPTWMFACDPDPQTEAASWRLSLKACLVRTDVIRKMGWLDPAYKTLEGASLDMGHRWINRGVFMRHIPALAPVTAAASAHLPFEEELRFIHFRFGKFWMKWAVLRAIFTGYANLFTALGACFSVHAAKPSVPFSFYQKTVPADSRNSLASVTVLIPTLNRYPYLRVILDQLRKQTVPALEIMIVDQTAKDQRDLKIETDFKDLPLKMMYQDAPGQCVSRNAGLQAARGTHILFLDDDDEVPETLIENHLKTLAAFKCDVSSGAVKEVGAGPIPENFRFIRQSDVFPTNNTMIRKDILKKSGLFDLAYNRKQRADGDLGMRVYLSGAKMILNPTITVLHHHAPQGGLRDHKARVMTYAQSRKDLFARHLVGDSEIYLCERYFSKTQVREMLHLRFWGTLTTRGSLGKRILKLLISLTQLPDTAKAMDKARDSADKMKQTFPQIPQLGEASHAW